MEVPFVSSGALSRGHYALVRKIESATSVQSTNQLLVTEIRSRREQLGRPGLSLEHRKESLIVLLYCRMTIAHGFLPNDAFDFALPHAVGLAEASQRLEQKRIGYLFCAEVMAPTHELQLMLVNTLRKDLESDSVPRICLALDNVIVSYNEDLVPAIQSRLQDLLSHTSPHVRRRVLLAFYSLSRCNPELLTRVSGSMTKFLEDPYQSVVSAALVISSLSSGAGMSQVLKLAVNGLLRKTLEDTQGYQCWFLLGILRTLFSLGLTEENIPIVFELARSSLDVRIPAVLRGVFLLFSKVSLKLLLSSRPGSPIEYLRPLLTSGNPNDQYLYLACLECVDPAAWSGNSPGIPAVLEAWEVERVMQLLESADALIRRTTLKLLNRIDLNIVAAYYSQTLQSTPSNLSVTGKNGHAVRMLELLESKSGEDGELYGRELMKLLVQLESATPTGGPVLEPAVERVLLYLRNAHIEFRVRCSTTLLTFVLESELYLPQTLMIVITALAAEDCGKLPISPPDLLQGLAIRLTSCIPSVQDVCLMSMLRITADCGRVPTQVISTVTDLRQTSKRHVRQRCEQFLMYIHQKPILSAILKDARSSSLPDFIEALYKQPTLSPEPTFPSQPATSSQELPTMSKLRYQAYDTPSPVPKLRSRRAPDTRYSTSSPRPEADDSRAGSNSPLGSTHALSGELMERQQLAKHKSPELHASLSLNQSPNNDSTQRMDLIVFDSSFIPETREMANATHETDFERLWASVGNPINSARGWCDASVDKVVKSLQIWDRQYVKVIPANVAPFIGEVKVVIRLESDEGIFRASHEAAMLRLVESEDESSLWRLRSSNGQLRTRVQKVLTECDK